MGTLFSAQACTQKVKDSRVILDVHAAEAGRGQGSGLDQLLVVLSYLLELCWDGFGIRDFLLWDFLGFFSHNLVHTPVQTWDGHLNVRRHLFTCRQTNMSQSCKSRRALDPDLNPEPAVPSTF